MNNRVLTKQAFFNMNIVFSLSSSQHLKEDKIIIFIFGRKMRGAEMLNSLHEVIQVGIDGAGFDTGAL